MSLRKILLERLEKGPIYASTHQEVAQQCLEIDSSRETATAAVGVILDGLLSEGLVSKEQEPDEFNYDFRRGTGPLVGVYQLTDDGKARLPELLARSSV